MTNVGISGLGAVGSQLLQRLQSRNDINKLVIYDSDYSKLGKYSRKNSQKIQVASSPKLEQGDIDVLFLCTPSGQHLEYAHRAVRQGISIISVSDRISDVTGMLSMGEIARESECTVVAGAGFSPGLTCVLASFLSDNFDVVDEIHIAKDGTGGPACARQHHRAMKRPSLDWRDGQWVRRPGGSGRELVWFPEPVGGADCYRAALPDAALLQPLFPEVSRITARLSASRQDRFTSWLPMLTPPHNDGGIGAVRVEVRGQLNKRRETKVLGVASPPSTLSAIIGETALSYVKESNLYGAGGIASIVPAEEFVGLIRQKGVRIFEFDGIPSSLDSA